MVIIFFTQKFQKVYQMLYQFLKSCFAIFSTWRYTYIKFGNWFYPINKKLGVPFVGILPTFLLFLRKRYNRKAYFLLPKCTHCERFLNVSTSKYYTILSAIFKCVLFRIGKAKMFSTIWYILHFLCKFWSHLNSVGNKSQ